MIVLATIISTLIVYSRFPSINQVKFSHQVIILGFDGLSPKIIDSLMKQDQLPNFKKLSQIGSYHQLATTNPPQSPVAWSGFATGQNPGKHGVYDFITRDPQDYSLTLSLSQFDNKNRPLPVKQTPSFWQYASDIGVPSTIIGCPVTFPPDKFTGQMLSGMGVPDILGTEGTFTFYTSKRLSSNQETGGQYRSVF